MHSIHLVREFHFKFGHPVAAEITVPDAKTRLLRFRLIFEELLEFGRANMSKLGANGEPILDAAGKVVKGPNYRAPDVSAVLATTRP